ncbi:hypothetical protein [Streptomyces sp. NPDC048338]|uniref:hypothetical protein n=1 Tax=Streptomyces sp. NPDC048338 TaxID=3365536 RepID=UPI0037152CBD
MSRTKKAAVVIAVIALGATGCGTNATSTGAGATAAPPSAARTVSPRPAGTGPLTKDVVRSDLDTSAAGAGLPANAPEFAGMNEDAPAGSPRACGVGYKGYSTKIAPVDTARFDRMVGELRGRDWQQSGERTERKGKDGAVFEARVILKQRGWTVVTQYRALRQEGDITLMAYDDACMKKNGGADPLS